MSFFGLGPEDFLTSQKTTEECARDLVNSHILSAFRGGDPTAQIRASGEPSEVIDLAIKLLAQQAGKEVE